jgi:hypothetical protein
MFILFFVFILRPNRHCKYIKCFWKKQEKGEKKFSTQGDSWELVATLRLVVGRRTLVI